VPWHTRKTAEVLTSLATSAQGLAAGEAAQRLRRHGPNLLAEAARKSLLAMFASQFKDFMILVLLGAAVVAGLLGEAADTVAIIVIVVLNAVIGFVQEYRAEQAMAMLRQLSAQVSLVFRDGVPLAIPAADLVPGDVVLLEAGTVVPADLRLFEVASLKIQEATLTGESLALEKQVAPLADQELSLGDRRNMAYKGTFVSYGRGLGVVVTTGMATELGRIATLLQEEEEVRTPLQKRLTVFSRNLALGVLAICAIVFVVGLVRGEQPLLMLLTAISLAVAAIPEALPAVITISLALGARKLIRQNALIRKLPAVETLGSVTTICSDKTGTLTENRMSVEELFTNGRVQPAAEADPSASRELFLALALSNDARLDGAGEVQGDPTEIALYQLAAQRGFVKDELVVEFPRVAEIPFDSDRKCMTTCHLTPDGHYLFFTKGATDVLLDRAEAVLSQEGREVLSVAELLAANDRMAADGLRVLAIAVRVWDHLPEELSPDEVERELTILGLVGMMDPPRAEAREAVRQCRTAGIRPVMITGDHPLTAESIARRLGISSGRPEELLSGRELARLSPAEFAERVEHVQVYARVSPEQKLTIVKALQEKGEFVAMTGDGVNDAPALKRADIGIAMGITGTDVTREASHMVLLDDNFATIVKAVKEGRRIFDNIRKFIKYTLTSNSGEIWAIFLAPLLGLPIPLLPIHILWINLVTDGLPGLALAVEPAEKGVMERPPRPPGESIFANGLGPHILWVGLLMGGVCLFTQAWSIRQEFAHWQTMVFTVLCLSQMGHVLAIRAERESIFRQGFFSNKALAGAFLLTFSLQMATIYVPALNPIFKTEPLSPGELLLTLALSSLVFFAVEVEKLVKRRKAAVSG
jgi:P-type Ca2+ transporter type 2C